MTKPITVWIVICVLEELEVPYEIKSFKFDDVKKPPFIDVNPNGRVPAIVDPNTNLTLWESGAIIQYLEEVYDTEKRLTYDTLNEKHLLNQYLHFQMSGQGPYYGQAGWFTHLHHEDLPSARNRYLDEVHRILGVLNGLLEGKQWLVGDKCTFADLSFLPWNCRLNMFLGADPLAKYPNVLSWHQRMEERPAWKRSMEIRDKLMDEQGLQPNGMPKGILNMEQYQEFIAKSPEDQQKYLDSQK
ncbi:glutathione transferase [Penicillium herquei]|nr:glutathione transferase [Penicillium herquei]